MEYVQALATFQEKYRRVQHDTTRRSTNKTQDNTSATRDNTSAIRHNTSTARVQRKLRL